jgi:hypothetical protein
MRMRSSALADRPDAKSISERHEQWLFGMCYDAEYRLRDQALNLLLCSMHILSVNKAVCLVGIVDGDADGESSAAGERRTGAHGVGEGSLSRESDEETTGQEGGRRCRIS